MTTGCRGLALLLVAACGGGSDKSDDIAESSGGGSDGSSSSSTSDVGMITGIGESSGNEGDASSGSTSSADTSDASSSEDSSSTSEPELPPTIGLVQYDADAHFGDWDYNVASLTEWAEAAIDGGATILVFPEGSSWGYATPTELWCVPGMDEFGGRACVDVSTVAEPLPGGPTTDYWAAFAAEHDVTVVYHVLEVDDADFYNAIGVVDPDGFVASYRKRTLYWIDQAYATPGDASVAIDTPGGRFGLMICIDGTYDGGYYDEYAAQGVDGIIISMDWDDDPNGPAAAVDWFRERAANNDVRIYAADVSTWDGTAFYPPGDVPRERNGLPAIAIDIDGISVHTLDP
jgi:predicted amidohydrolase